MDNKELNKRIISVVLTTSILLSGCSKYESHDKFNLTENSNNEILAEDNSYISSSYIHKYYVVETYNELTKKNEIYIAYQKSDFHDSTSLTINLYDVFTGFKICSYNTKTNESYDESNIRFIKETPLTEYLVSFGLEQVNYSYEEMQNVFNVIQDNYVFNEELTRRLVP